MTEQSGSDGVVGSAREGFECLPSAVALDGEIADAVRLLGAGVDRLLEIGDRGDLMALGADRLIGVLREVEAHRCRLRAVDSLLVEAAREERLAEHVAAPSLRAALSELLRIAPGTAAARIALAEQTLPRHELSAGPLAPRHPVLAAAVRGGQITGDQERVIGAALRRLATHPALSDGEVARAEGELVGQAAVFGPKDLTTIAGKIDDVLLPDGTLAPEEIARARRELVLGPERRDGTHAVRGSLTRDAHAQLWAVLSPLAAPRHADDATGRDPRSAGQRMHDALQDAAARLLDSGTLPASGGAPATIHILIEAETLLEQVRAASEREQRRVDGGGFASGWDPARTAGVTSTGDPVSIDELLRLADQAELIPTYLNRAGGILGYGRIRRFASPSQTQALIGRDRGCSFPTCTAPPQWCQRHHVIAWWNDGQTHLQNLTLVCGYHHREFQRHGWSVQMLDGIPAWIPPAVLDPTRTPRINPRIGRLRQLDLTHLPDPLARAETDLEHRYGDPPGTDPEILDDLDDLCRLLTQHIPAEARDEFHRELTDLLHTHHPEPATGQLTGTA